MEAAGMMPSFDLEALVEAVAERVTEKILDRFPANSIKVDDPLLLTVEQAARKLGRTVPAVEHLIREGRLPVVRFDRRVFIDTRDILSLIERHKMAADRSEAS
jgi:excisionase family DNA binding protein